ncbi:acetolactate decarboxylase [Clostridium sp. JN-1]|jgi:acetolactate decarboxylase|nr:acetolactate decarboxylase [Clostridium sp. JN-1]
MAEAVKNQPTFKYKYIDGYVVGFTCPSFVEGLNVPGHHFHLISKNK